MQTYRVVFSSQSVLNDIPNSQTLFGALCTIILQTQGQSAFKEYIDSLINKEAKFVHSSMFLNGALPMVKQSIFSLDSVNELVKNSSNQDKLNVLENTKKYKKINSMSYGIYEKYIVTEQMNQLKQDLQSNEDLFSVENGFLRFSNEDSLNENASLVLTRNGFPEKGTDKTLFYAKAHYYLLGTEFCVYVKTNESKEYLENIFKYLEYFGVGNRRTVGNNCFKLKRIESVDFSDSKVHKLILSRYIPNKDEVNFEESFYQLTTNVYHTSKEYGKGLINGKFIHILEGSWMKMNDNKDYYGRIIETSVNGKIIYHYGIGFSV